MVYSRYTQVYSFSSIYSALYISNTVGQSWFTGTQVSFTSVEKADDYVLMAADVLMMADDGLMADDVLVADDGLMVG